jgi:tetratricopeptide (TPR) repeat protein
MKIGDLYSIQEKFKIAQGWYLRALDYDPENKNLLFKLGQNAFFLKQLESAINYFQKIIVIDSTLSDFNILQKSTLYYFLALSHANLKNWEKANIYLSKSLKENKDFTPSLKLRSEIKNY